MKFTETHEWLLISGATARIGITDYAQKELGEIVYIELPRLGHKMCAGDPAAVLESTKAAVDIYAPVSGEVIAVNDALHGNPSLINTAPQSLGWLYTLHLHDPKELDPFMDAEAYNHYTQ